MSVIALFELDTPSGVDDVKSKIGPSGIPFDVTELDADTLARSEIAQTKRVEVYLRVYESLDDETTTIQEVCRIGSVLLGVSDGEVFYYRSSHAQEKDAEEVAIDVGYIESIPPTLDEPNPKRYVLRK